MRTVYVLECQNSKYYVGQTDRPLEFRISEHKHHQGSEWTKLYQPIRLIDSKENADEFDEDKYTKIYMKRYGIENVRGGSYTQITLPVHLHTALLHELSTVSNTCHQCGSIDHFINQCPSLNLAKPKKKSGSSKKITRVFDGSTKAKCFRCERLGHYANECHYKTLANGRQIK
jgi:hypothetical protein